MNTQQHHNNPDSHESPFSESTEGFDSVEIDKIKQVISSGWGWILLIIAVTIGASFLYIRYTKPVYNAESILKLDIQNEAGMIGLANPFQQNIKGLSGEIELVTSRLFLNEVVHEIGMTVSYHYPGRSHLIDERYGDSPFRVSYELNNNSALDKRIDLEILDDQTFSLSFHEGSIIASNHLFGKPITTDAFNFVIQKTDFFEQQKGLGTFYFKINSQNTLINYLKRSLKAEPLNLNAKTLKLSFSDHEPQKAKDLLMAIDTLYLEFTKKAKNKAVEQKIAFLDEQMGRTSIEIDHYENYFETFTIEHRTTNLDNDLNKTISLLNSLDSQRYKINIRLGELELLSNNLQSINDDILMDMPSTVKQLFTSYLQLTAEKEVKLLSYSANTQIIQNINQKLLIAEQTAYKRAEIYQKNLTKSLLAIDRKIEYMESTFEKLPSMGNAYNKRRRMYSLHEDLYFSLIKNKIDLEIAKAGTVTNFVILSPASVSSIPIHPKTLIIYGIGFIVGLFLSALFMGIKYILHDKITSQKELEKLLHAPILGLVPKYKQEKMENSKLIVTDNPKSSISESLRAIRTNMEFIRSGEENKLISVTSTVSGEGKTFIAVNLGAVFAYAGKKVVVVDLDMRKPKVHLAFSAEKLQKGVSTILIGKDTVDECIQHSELENLDFISAGPTPPNPSELILGDTFDSFLEELKWKYDIIFLDSPPVGLVTDGVLVMQKSDIPIYVVRADYSKVAYLKSVHRLISNNKFKNLSVVFNGVKTSRGDTYGYGYGYGDNGYYEE